MTGIAAICVYCGASNNVDAKYLEAAEQLGRLLARDGRRLIYGGGKPGLMGRLANGALAEGGAVTGIIPEHLQQQEPRHEGPIELLIVNSMHERKAEMVRRADAFCVLPGGIGTLDEMIEILSWRYLGLHGKPVAVVDLDGFWKPLRQLLRHLVDAGFTDSQMSEYMVWVDSVDQALTALDSAHATRMTPRLDKV